MTQQRQRTVHFDPLDPSLAEPYHRVSAEIREECPVVFSDGHWAPDKTGFWLVTGYPETDEIARDPRRFINGEGATPVQFDLDVVRLIPLENDEPMHKQMRLKLNPFFIASAIDAVEGGVQRIVDEIIDDCLAQDPCDMITQFSTVLPPRAYFELFLHQQLEDVGHILEAVDIMQTQPERAMEVTPVLFEWCAQLLAAARDEGRTSDIIGTVAHMGLDQSVDGFTLTEAERIQMMYLMIVAGIDTTQSALGCMFHELAIDPSLREQIRRMDDSTLAYAVEELLRYVSPVTLAGRTVGKDTDVGGCPMAKGDRINLSWIAANRDPRVFAQPDKIDFDRPNARRHVAFGAGIHLCIGNNLARREIRLALRAVSRLSRFELATDEVPPDYRAGFTRGPIKLPMHLAR
jgi:cytochrome P450